MVTVTPETASPRLLKTLPTRSAHDAGCPIVRTIPTDAIRIATMLAVLVVASSRDARARVHLGE
jgi:hypothetical protein